jgi:membrane protein DedA with SNARE-associated domain/rhodanese-related sulfurtransferase
VLLVAGALSVSGGAQVIAVIAVAVSAAMIADLIWYAAGVRYGRRALGLVCRISLSPDSCIRQTENVLSRSGPWSLLFVKFVPGLRYVSVVLAGIQRLKLALFVFLDGLGNVLYFAVAVVLGWLFHDALDAVMARLVHLGIFGAALVAAGLAMYWAVRWIERQRFIRQLRMDRISIQELTDMIDAGQVPVIVDVRPAEARMREGMIPGALASGISEGPRVLQHLSREAEIVVYCTCPNEASAAMMALHLKRAGFKRIRPLLGGMEAWVSAGRAIETAVSDTASAVALSDRASRNPELAPNFVDPSRNSETLA